MIHRMTNDQRRTLDARRPALGVDRIEAPRSELRAPSFAEGGPPATEDRALREATREFEAFFVAQLMQSMRRTVPESGLFGGEGEHVFRDMLDQERAQLAAKANALGIGEMLYQQLVPETEGKQRS